MQSLVSFLELYRLSNELVSFLHEKGCYYLDQVGFGNSNGRAGKLWKSVYDLGLQGQLKEEWDRYLPSLKEEWDRYLLGLREEWNRYLIWSWNVNLG